MRINITLSDAINSGGLREAIIDFCSKTEGLASGPIGLPYSIDIAEASRSSYHKMEYIKDATDLVRKSNRHDYARRWLQEGVLIYIDEWDGRAYVLDKKGRVACANVCVVFIMPPTIEEVRNNWEISRDFLKYGIERYRNDKDVWEEAINPNRKEWDDIMALYGFGREYV